MKLRGHFQFGQLRGLKFASFTGERLPEQLDIHFGLQRRYLFGYLPRCSGEVAFRGGAVNDNNAVATHTEVSSPGIDDMEAIAFLLADVCETQLVRIEKFDDTALQRHGYNCGT
jgi:hypothetical protein